MSNEELEALRAVFAEMPESVAVYDLDGAVRYVNPTTERIFGKTLAELWSKRLFDVFPEARGNPFHAAFERVAAGGATEVFEHYYAPWDVWFANRVARVRAHVHVVARD